ncbi:MAG: hypothetical protein ACKO86_08675, partial [Dolichospermum sp.]
MNSPGQLQPPDVFIGPLLELRDYYQSLAQKYQLLFIEARSQLDHGESLLATRSYVNCNGHQSIWSIRDGLLLWLSS